jgi:hypothetical protein
VGKTLSGQEMQLCSLALLWCAPSGEPGVNLFVIDEFGVGPVGSFHRGIDCASLPLIEFEVILNRLRGEPGLAALGNLGKFTKPP